MRLRQLVLDVISTRLALVGQGQTEKKPMNHFDRLGLPRRFSVDRAELERAYLARSREIHPDRHQLGSQAEQSASVELSAALNESYQTLKDPYKRAEYILTLAGAPTAAETRDMDLAFLDEMLELRMEIGSLKPDSSETDAMDEQLSSRMENMLQKVGEFLDAPPTAENLLKARRELNSVKYVSNLLRDLRAL